jgi:hypothetical protein
MRSISKWAGVCAAAAAGAGAASAFADTPPSANGVVAAVEDGAPILDVRSRFEDVAQANLAPLAQSFSTRLQAGWQTAPYDGFTALVEFAGLVHLDGGNYNVAVPGLASLNGRATFPIINDPTFATLNRGQLAWSPDKHVRFTVGRQRILIDDQRFVGNSAWRQDEVRFDSARADLSIGNLTASYAYVWHVDRIFGGQLDWNSSSHLANVAYAVARPLTLEGFLYALDFTDSAPAKFDNAPANSSLTGGVRASGTEKIGRLGLAYAATWARETNYGNQPSRFGLDFWQGDVAATYGIATAQIDYEQLGGNGVQGFFTPIATTHAFQGWADAFAADAGNKTEPDGIRDINFAAIVNPDWKATFLRHPQLIVRYYDFHAQLTGAYVANEWDAQLQAEIVKGLTGQLTFAAYQRANAVPVGTVPAPPSRTKVWVSLEYRL